MTATSVRALSVGELERIEPFRELIDRGCEPDPGVRRPLGGSACAPCRQQRFALRSDQLVDLFAQRLELEAQCIA
jgi:hypothetical protein